MSAAEQRKLQLVYDDIDHHRYKPALAELNRYLKKQPKSQLALCLKVVCLGGLESPEEDILAAYEAAKRFKPFTEPAAHSLAFAFRAMRRNDLILEMYQELAEDDSKNPEWAEKALMAAVEAWDTKAMMQSSRKLATAVNIPKVARWAAFSHFVQSATLPNSKEPYPPAAPPKSLLMAAHFLKASNANLTAEPSVDVVWLNLHVLLADGQLEAAHAYIKEHARGGALTRKWLRLKVVPVIGERLAKGGEWSGWTEEWEWTKSLITEREEPERNFAYYRYLIDCLARVLQAAGNPSSHPLLTSTRELLLSLEQKHGQRERAPLLALLELESRAAPNQMCEPQEWLDIVERYWDAWGSLPVVCDELDGVIPEDRFKDVMDLFSLTTNADHEDLVSFRRLVTHETLLMARRKREAITFDIARKHWAMYMSGLKYGESLGKDDVQPADPAAFMAIHGILAAPDPAIDTETRLLQAAACLEVVARHGPASPYTRFLLARIYRSLGAIALAVPHLQALKISEIMLTTLLHIFSERSSTLCRLAGVQDAWKGYVETSHTVSAREIAQLDNSRKVAVESESYSKIGGLLELKDSLARSMALCEGSTETINQMAQTEPRQLIDLMKRGILLKSMAAWTGIADLRDWDLIPNLGPEDVRMKELTQTSEPITPQQSLSTVRAWRRLQSIWSGEEAGVLAEAVPETSSFLSEAIDMLHQHCAQRASGEETAAPAVSLDPIAAELLRELETSDAMARPVICSRIIELRSIVNLAIVGTEASHFKGKPKKQVQATAALHSELREVKKAFDAQVLAIVKQIDDTKAPEAKTAIIGEPIDAVRREVNKARETSWISFRKMMKKQ